MLALCVKYKMPPKKKKGTVVALALCVKMILTLVTVVMLAQCVKVTLTVVVLALCVKVTVLVLACFRATCTSCLQAFPIVTYTVSCTAT